MMFDYADCIIAGLVIFSAGGCAGLMAAALCIASSQNRGEK